MLCVIMNACVQNINFSGAAAEKDYMDDEKNVKYVIKEVRINLSCLERGWLLLYITEL